MKANNVQRSTAFLRARCDDACGQDETGRGAVGEDPCNFINRSLWAAETERDSRAIILLDDAVPFRVEHPRVEDGPPPMAVPGFEEGEAARGAGELADGVVS
jgi:hypothetical protein